MSFDIYSLPISVSCNVLGVLLTLKPVVFLDSAFCSRSKRFLFHILLEAKELVLHDPVTLPNRRLLVWLKQRSMKVSSMTFTGAIQPHELLCYIIQFGNALRSVNFDRLANISDIMFIIAAYCKKIKSVRCSGVTLPHAFPALLANNPNITVIKVKDTNSFHILTDHVCLSRMETLSLIDVECNTGWSLLKSNRSIKQIECVRIPPQFFHGIDTPRPCLRSLSLKRSVVPYAKAVSFLSASVNLVNLDLSYNDKIKDDTILYVAKHLSCLRTLCIQHTDTTDVCLTRIAEYCGDRLEMLYANIRNPTTAMTEQIVQKFSEKCVVLNHLNVHTVNALCSGSCAFSLIQGCPAMIMLESNHIGSTTCKFAALIRPQLKIVMSDGNNIPYNVLTLPI